LYRDGVKIFIYIIKIMNDDYYLQKSLQFFSDKIDELHKEIDEKIEKLTIYD
jgi:hypothetical protein